MRAHRAGTAARGSVRVGARAAGKGRAAPRAARARGQHAAPLVVGAATARSARARGAHGPAVASARARCIFPVTHITQKTRKNTCAFLPHFLTRIPPFSRFRNAASAALFKLVKKYNKATRAPRHARLAALPLLLASPLFHSRPLQLLFQRAAKWRHEGSQHGGGAALAMAAAAERAAGGGSAHGGIGGIGGALNSPMKAHAGGGPLSPLRPRGAGVPIFGGGALRLQAGGGGGLSDGGSYHGSSGSLLFADGCGSPSPPVRCEGCVRGQTRFVVLGCAHTFCWGCVAASLVRQRRLLQRQASLGGGGGGGGGGSRGSGIDLAAAPPSPDAAGEGAAAGGEGAAAAAAAAAAVPAAQRQPLPPNAGLLSRRLCAPDSPWDPAGGAPGAGGAHPGGGSSALHSLASAQSFGGLGSASSASLLGDAAACEPALLECPVCDAAHNLDDGHLEVNPLSGDAGCYVWMLAPAEGRMSRRNPSRSRLAGMDFASLSVYGSVGSSPKFGGGGGAGAGVLHGDGISASVGAGAPGGSGWPKGLARVPSWNSLSAMSRPA
jgi:hypothetical protein